jgi:ubiquinone/menaquinone biosynthesis C-methylase UbiE
VIITQLVERFLNFLYGPLAFSYDLVAWLVSFGQWKSWSLAVIPFLEGTTVLELGFGPGSLLDVLKENGFTVLGVDRSRQMSKMARRRLRKTVKPQNSPQNETVIRAEAEHIPVMPGCFDTVLATFPTRYIFHPGTLAEIKRLLKPEGRLVVLLAARPRRDSFLSTLLFALYRITGESPAAEARIEEFIANTFAGAGFKADISWLPAKYADLLLIKCG